MNAAIKQNIMVVIITLIVSLLLAEFILRKIYYPHKVASGWSWLNGPTHDSSLFRNELPNELGYRGQPIKYEKNDYVVVLIGDSQVEAATSPSDKMPEKLLQNICHCK
jgi:hypothetical protein